MRILILLCFFYICSAFHGYHIGIIEIKHNETSKTLEVALKLSSDDLERILKIQGLQNPLLGSEKENPVLNDSIQSYLFNHFSIWVNNTPCKAIFLGKEVEIHDTWCYLEVPNISNIEAIKIKNSIFMEYLEEQSHRVVIEANNTKKSILFSTFQRVQTVQYKD